MNPTMSNTLPMLKEKMLETYIMLTKLNQSENLKK